MSVLVNSQGRQLLLVKGAPESVLSRCTHALVNGGGGTVSAGGAAVGGGPVAAMTDGMRASLLRRASGYGGVWMDGCGLQGFCLYSWWLLAGVGLRWSMKIAHRKHHSLNSKTKTNPNQHNPLPKQEPRPCAAWHWQ